MATGTILPGLGDEVLITFSCAIVITLVVSLIAFIKMFSRVQSSSSLSADRPHHSYNNELCPICLGDHVLAVETNCGHKFCGSCLTSYINNVAPHNFSMFNGTLKCPVCRQNINILLLSFTQDEMHSAELAGVRTAVQETVNTFNVRFGTRPQYLWGYIKDCPILIRHMVREFFTLGGIVWMFRLRVILCFLGALLYLCTPIDFIPEAVFGLFGFIDDVIVFLLCAIYVSILYRRLVVNRGRNLND